MDPQESPFDSRIFEPHTATERVAGHVQNTVFNVGVVIRHVVLAVKIVSQLPESDATPSSSLQARSLHLHFEKRSLCQHCFFPMVQGQSRLRLKGLFLLEIRNTLCFLG
jgi:hypothetical protein